MGKKILVIDDHQELLDTIEMILQTGAYDVSCFLSTDNVVQTVLDTEPDLALIDYVLAGLNGGELCAELKNHSATKEVPVVLMSAYPAMIELSGGFGQDAFISKPFNIDELLETVKMCLQKGAHA